MYPQVPTPYSYNDGVSAGHTNFGHGESGNGHGNALGRFGNDHGGGIGGGFNWFGFGA